ncbi:MAG: tRNA (adenosine(37)-N6)-threonylcarbamoyltransferase complex dimerization subunit type 1 TsaB [Bryobacteraceae bacterium]
MILAIDTSTPVAGFALVSPSETIVRALESSDGHAQKLFLEIESLLAEAGARLQDIECFAAGAGPGSFTGVRVALAAAKGLAHALERPACAVSNLAALAWFGTKALRAPVLDARRGEVYGAVYDADLNLVREECVTPLDRFLAGVPAEAEVIRAASQHPVVAIGQIALQRYERGQAVDAAIPEANYIRPPDIREPAR